MRMCDLPAWFEGLPAYESLAPNTKRNYGIWLKSAIDTIGPKVAIRSVDYSVADILFSKISNQTSKHKAVYVCRVCSVLWNLLIRHERATKNPFARMRLPSLQHRTEIWSPEQVLAFSRACDSLGHYPLGLLAEVCYYACQRPIDIRLMVRESFLHTRLSLTQIKTGIEVNIYLTTEYRVKLSQIVRSHNHQYIFVNPDTGIPYTARDYNKIAFDAKRRARIPLKLQLRDLRRTGLTEAADKGASDPELMSLAGHTRVESLKPYRLRTLKQTENAQKKRFGLA